MILLASIGDSIRTSASGQDRPVKLGLPKGCSAISRAVSPSGSSPAPSMLTKATPSGLAILPRRIRDSLARRRCAPNGARRRRAIGHRPQTMRAERRDAPPPTRQLWSHESQLPGTSLVPTSARQILQPAQLSLEGGHNNTSLGEVLLRRMWREPTSACAASPPRDQPGVAEREFADHDIANSYDSMDSW